MAETDVAALLRDAMLTTFRVGAPPLLAGLLIGVIMALLQAITQINEASLAFVPKVLAIGAALVLFGGVMFAALQEFTHELMGRIVALGNA